MENYNLHRRAQSGWHPTTYSRPVDKKPERNWAALTEAAKRPPVGYWEDAPKGIQFGGGGAGALPKPSEPANGVAAPSVSSDASWRNLTADDSIECGDVLWNSRNGKRLRVDAFTSSGNLREIGPDGVERLVTDFELQDDAWRILRRTKGATGARAWKNRFGVHWLSIGVKWFAASPFGSWTQYADNWLAGSAMAGWVEQSPAEIQRLVDEATAAMNGK